MSESVDTWPPVCMTRAADPRRSQGGAALRRPPKKGLLKIDCIAMVVRIPLFYDARQWKAVLVRGQADGMDVLLLTHVSPSARSPIGKIPA